jgi:hypothetical protein
MPTLPYIHEEPKDIRSDIKIITGKLAVLDSRVSLIEQRLKI